MSSPRASLIVSVYRDTEALECILHAAARQSVDGLEVIISEDGEDPTMASLAATWRGRFTALQHLSQEDLGWRKNRALNRAILAASSDRLLFIDGDCVPHSRFVEAHLDALAPGRVCTGRRVELGPDYSARVRHDPDYLARLERPLHWLRQARDLHRDGIKDYELGLPSLSLGRMTRERRIALVGCNLSAMRSDLERINGFDEAYTSPGIGEDVDLEWRLRGIGIQVANVKLSAAQYHLHHARGYSVHEENYRLLREAEAAQRFVCANGLDSHRSGETT